jgi:hypothetical protein
MLIPSAGLLKILHESQVGVWPELLVDDSIALVVKLPQTIIKRVYRGIECKLVTAVIKVAKYNILYLGFVVYDDAKNPFVITQAIATQKVLTEFQQMFRASPIKLHMLDELCHPLLEASCDFDPIVTSNTFDRIMSTNPHVLESNSSDINDPFDFGQAVINGIDLFQRDLESIRTGRSCGSAPNTNCVIPLPLIVHHPPDGFSIDGIGNAVEFTLTREDEGPAFEELLFFTMRDLYLGHAYLRPIIKVGGKEREVADLLALSHTDNTILLIQAKATASLSLHLEQPTERRTSSTRKKVENCFRQLVGAIKQIRAGKDIYDCNHNRIAIPQSYSPPIHAIIVVSELYAFVDWREIGRYLSSMSDNEEHRALFQVVDLQELQQLVKNSRSKEDFHHYLAGRWLKVKMSGTAYVRSRTRQPWDNEADLS